MKKEGQSLMLVLTKNEVRQQLLNLRKEIPVARRQQARESMLQKLYPRLQGFSKILSFFSLPDEIDTLRLNGLIIKEKSLFLPKIEKENLESYSVTDLTKQMAPSTRLRIHEPISEKCLLMTPEKLDCVLVPALGFDREQRRIGYGKGHYDRFITRIRKSKPCALLIGVGFEEQLVKGGLPFEPHDQLLDEVWLF